MLALLPLGWVMGVARLQQKITPSLLISQYSARHHVADACVIVHAVCRATNISSVASSFQWPTLRW